MKTDDFIEIYDNVLTQEECQHIIKYFEEMQNLDLVFNRQDVSDSLKHEKDDETCFLFEPDTFLLEKTHPIIQIALKKFWGCYQEYAKKYSILMKSAPHGTLSARLQKTKPGGGYHIWHYETQTGKLWTGRFITYMIYLNTVPVGGETEFLYQNCRVNAVEGRIVIWPAGFTHTHRGNQPIGKDKYAITGWVEFLE